MSLLSMPAVVAAQELALRSQQSRGEHADSLTVVAADLEAIRAPTRLGTIDRDATTIPLRLALASA